MIIQGRLVSSALVGMNYPSQIFSLFDITKKKKRLLSFETKMKKSKRNNFRDLDKHFLKHWLADLCMVLAKRLQWKCIRGKRRETNCSGAGAVGSSVEVKSAPEMHFWNIGTFQPKPRWAPSWGKTACLSPGQQGAICIQIAAAEHA